MATCVNNAMYPETPKAVVRHSTVARRSGDVPRPLLADAVVNACRLSIAGAGTIVLGHEVDQGHRASTRVPERQVRIVRAEQFVANALDSKARLDRARPLTWRSEPSATSDIEFERVDGVHGPRTLIAVIIDDRHSNPAIGGDRDGPR